MIRERSALDLCECVVALRPVHEVDGYPIHWPEDPESWLDPPGLTRAWIAVRDGEIVGHVGVLHQSGPARLGATPSDRDAQGKPRSTDQVPTAVVTRLFVTPWARGGGVAAALLEAVLADARRSGRMTVLEVVDGTGAVELYERLGWIWQETRPSDWTAADDLHRLVRVYREPPRP